MLTSAQEIGAISIASAVVLLQCLTEGSPGDNSGQLYWFWAVLVSFAAALICIVALLFIGPYPLNAATRKIALQRVDAISLFLALLWTAGVGVMTFERPFSYTGNGYFASWTAFLFSWHLALRHNPRLQRPLEEFAKGTGMPMALLLAASLLVLVQTALSCGSRWCGADGTWILIWSIVSLALAVLLILPDIGSRCNSGSPFVALFFLAGWGAAIFSETFRGVYEHTGNGYFGTWAAFIASICLFARSWNPVSYRSHAEHIQELGHDERDRTAPAPWEIWTLFWASVVLLVASAIECSGTICDGWTQWAIIFSAISTAATALLLLFILTNMSRDTLHLSLMVLSPLLLGLWAVGAVTNTFVSPFWYTGNGYFSSWIGLAAAATLALKSFEAFSGSQFAHFCASAFCVLLIASGVLLAQLLVDAGANRVNYHDGHWIWGAVCAALSFLICLFSIPAFGLVQGCLTPVGLLLFLLWIMIVAVVTFIYPYMSTGNGFFAAWIGFAASALFVSHHWPHFWPKQGEVAFEEEQGQEAPRGEAVGPQEVRKFEDEPRGSAEAASRGREEARPVAPLAQPAAAQDLPPVARDPYGAPMMPVLESFEVA